MKFFIFTDGAARGNPGSSASGYRIFDGRKNLLVEHVFYNGVATNNVAEYKAIIAALKKLGGEYGYENEVDVYSDSRVVVNQLKGGYRVRNKELQKLYDEANSAARGFRRCDFINVFRSNRQISGVDRALNRLLDRVKKEKKANSSKSIMNHQARLFE